MPNITGGYWQRLVRRFTGDAVEPDTDDLSHAGDDDGARSACDCHCGEEVTVRGKLRSVELRPREEAATLEAELYDGTEGITLVWLGRRQIAGIEPGRTLRARGRICDRDGHKVLYNPYYELQTSK